MHETLRMIVCKYNIWLILTLDFRVEVGSRFICITICNHIHLSPFKITLHHLQLYKNCSINITEIYDDTSSQDMTISEHVEAKTYMFVQNTKWSNLATARIDMYIVQVYLIYSILIVEQITFIVMSEITMEVYNILCESRFVQYTLQEFPACISNPTNLSIGTRFQWQRSID